MFEVKFELNGETQIIAGLTLEQATDVLNKGTFGVTADNLIEIVEVQNA
jgi:hypothetical protein